MVISRTARAARARAGHSFIGSGGGILPGPLLAGTGATAAPPALALGWPEGPALCDASSAGRGRGNGGGAANGWPAG